MISAKISLITVCYNSARTIRDTLNSVVGQDYQNVEYIVVDGASADDTMSIVEEYSDNINTVVSEPDAGLYDAYNKGLALATGDIIGFINSDDIYESAGVLSSVASIFEDDSIDACHANLVREFRGYISGRAGVAFKSLF